MKWLELWYVKLVYRWEYTLNNTHIRVPEWNLWILNDHSHVSLKLNPLLQGLRHNDLAANAEQNEVLSNKISLLHQFLETENMRHASLITLRHSNPWTCMIYDMMKKYFLLPTYQLYSRYLRLNLKANSPIWQAPSQQHICSVCTYMILFSTFLLNLLYRNGQSIWLVKWILHIDQPIGMPSAFSLWHLKCLRKI